MRRIAIVNQKGGVGKTTTTVNLAAALAELGHRVGILDLDPQAHATCHLGVAPDGSRPSMYDLLVHSKPLSDVLIRVNDRLWLAGSDINLAAAEVELAGVVGREQILRDMMQQDEAAFDFVFMDCGPSLGVLTLNALAACNEVFIPLQPHFLALHGMGKLLETTALVTRRINPNLKVTGVVLSMFEASTRLAQEVAQNITDFLAKARGTNVPWADARVFPTRIRRNIKLAECPSFGQPIFAYAPRSPGAEDYMALARDVLGEAEPVVTPTNTVDRVPALT